MTAKKAKGPILKPFKFVVQATVIEVDGTGGVLAERPGEVITLVGMKQLREWVDAFEGNLATATVTDEPLPR